MMCPFPQPSSTPLLLSMSGAPEISSPTQCLPSSFWGCLVALAVSAQIRGKSSQLSFGLSSVRMPFSLPMASPK